MARVSKGLALLPEQVVNSSSPVNANGNTIVGKKWQGAPSVILTYPIMRHNCLTNKQTCDPITTDLMGPLCVYTPIRRFKSMNVIFCSKLLFLCHIVTPLDQVVGHYKVAITIQIGGANNISGLDWRMIL